MSAARPRVLYLTTRFPHPPDRGDRLHAFHGIRVLSSCFDVTVACFAESPEEMSAGREVFREWGVRVITVPLGRMSRMVRLALALPTRRPLQVAYYEEPAMRRALERLAREEPPFDGLVCHLIRTAPYASFVRARVRVISLADSLALALDRRLAHAPWIERPSIWLEAKRVRSFEEHVLDGFGEGWVVSEVDRRAFPGGPDRLQVLPPGVDPSLLAVDPAPATDPVVGFMGHLSVPHNVDAVTQLVLEVLPRLRERGIDARVRLIGTKPSRAVRRLARLPGVDLVGYVEDLGKALGRVRVFCAPIRFSGGVQSKLIDALAVGTPVVTSSNAAAGLGDDANRWVYVADDAEECVRHIQALWNRDARLCEHLEGARRWAAERFRWERYRERLATLVGPAAGGVW